ncbi:MAG: nitroreductase/quinone reductase family protein [Acidimicrobiales bacterium]
MITKLVMVLIGGFALYYFGTALFERLAPRPWVRAYQRFSGRLFRPSAGIVPGWAVIETTGRRSGQPRQTPVGGRLRGNTFWLVAADRRRSQYVKNINANPKVRVRVHGRWRTGSAWVLPDDDPRRRMLHLNPVNSLFTWIAGSDFVTIRIDLDPADRKAPASIPGSD